MKIMRPPRQVQVITLHLEGLQDLLKQIEILAIHINDVIKKGKSWIEETDDNTTYLEINNFLINENTQCMQKCYHIATGNEPLSQVNLTKDKDSDRSLTQSASATYLCSSDERDFQRMKERQDDMEKYISLHTEKICNMLQNLKNLETQNEAILKEKEDLIKNIDSKIQDVMSQVKETKESRSQVNSQIEHLSNEIKGSKKIINSLHNNLKNQERLSQDILKKLDSESSLTKLTFDGLKNDISSSSDFIAVLQHQTDFLTSRMREVEKLLGDTASVSEPFKKCLEDVSRKIENIGSQVQDIIGKPKLKTGSVVGFDAFIKEDAPIMNLSRNQILTCFQHVTEDVQTNYDPDTGMFKVPVTGLYICALVIDISSFVPCDFTFCICVQRVSGTEEGIVATCHTKLKNTVVGDISLRHFAENERVYVRSMNYCKNLSLSSNSHFMCVLVKEQ